LNKSSTDILNEKVELIYEYDNKSPLFVHTANNEIERNNLNRAIEILNHGIELYPGYAAAYITLGKAFLLKGEYDAAEKFLQEGSMLLHSPKTYDFYKKEMETIKKQRFPFQNTGAQSFLNDDAAYDSPEEENIEEEFKLADWKIKPFDGDTKTDIDDRLEEVAKNLSNAKMPSPSEKEVKGHTEEKKVKEKIIPSETLAKIYISQGEYKEAIEIYKSLIAVEPAKKDYYASKIKEINEQIDPGNF
jgi:tetratricopeptide (TPR) repeat protein